MALPISIARRRTDIGTGWDGRIDEMSADLALIEKTTQKFTYNFAVNGGTAGTSIHLGVIPDNAVITAVWYEVMTTLTGGTPAVTLALEVATDAAIGNALVVAVAANSGTNVWTTLAASNVKGTVVGSLARGGAGGETALQVAAGKAATFVKTTSVGGVGRALDLTVGGASPPDDLTAGRLNVYVAYFIST